MYCLYYEGFFEPRNNFPNNWQVMVSNTGWRNAKLSLIISRKHRCQENFEVLMSCMVKYVSKSIYFKSLSKTKDKTPLSKHFFSQSTSGFCSFPLHWWNMFFHLLTYQGFESLWWPCLRVRSIYHYHEASEIGPICQFGRRNLHGRSFSSLSTTSINYSHQSPWKKQII